MARCVEVTIHAGNKASLNYQSQEVAVTLTYRLESGDDDLLAFVRDKARETKSAHEEAWRAMRSEDAAGHPPVRSGRDDETRNDSSNGNSFTSETGPPAEPAFPESAGTLSPVSVSAPDEESESLFADDDTALLEPATLAQVRLIESLWESGGYDEKARREKLLAASGHDDIDALTIRQAACLIVDLVGKARNLLEREREVGE